MRKKGLYTLCLLLFFTAVGDVCAFGLAECKQDCKKAVGGNVYSDENYQAYLNCERDCEYDIVGKHRAIQQIASGYLGQG